MGVSEVDAFVAGNGVMTPPESRRSRVPVAGVGRGAGTGVIRQSTGDAAAAPAAAAPFTVGGPGDRRKRWAG